jgi:hypothetical protein
MPNPDYCTFILTHGRPDKVKTFTTLRKGGYSGPLFLVIDDEDDKADEYYDKFGRDNVVMFCKEEQAKKVDEFDNFTDRRAILYARNACFEIAQQLGYEWFLQLDDDYQGFHFRMDDQFKHPDKVPTIKKTLGDVIGATFDFYKSVPATSMAFSQGGDWVGGRENQDPVKRKAMNSFFCSTRRPFQFVGRINEDVNTYTCLGGRGHLFFQTPIIQLCQAQTQKTAGGMTDLYLSGGTYVKSFYTILCSPNCVTIDLMGQVAKRLHHDVRWLDAVPCIIGQEHKKL